MITHMQNSKLNLLAKISLGFLFSLIPNLTIAADENIKLQPSYDADYANNRAQIEDLLARYSFALDWHDADTYAATFTQDGILDWAQGVVIGRNAIRKEILGAKSYFEGLAEQDAPLRPARLRHFITNAVIKIDGDTATMRAFWLEMYNANPQRKASSGAYGHSIDELKKVNGEWLFSLRKIYNEEMDDRAASWDNPAW